MLRAYRFAAGPKWAVGHLIVLALAVTMVLLGRWQLDVSESKHFSLQNFGYALQWWAFTAFGLVLWWRIVRDAARRNPSDAHPLPQPAEPGAAQPEPVAYRRYVMPQSSDGPPAAADAEHAAYNAYLAELAGQPEENR